ncbi:MAG: DUF177 domain-containing protein [Ignavibacteriae bacterium]|nr:DUF177 domain-containing protein [Ignavibacteriota bacterium]
MIIKITNFPVGVHKIEFEKSISELQLGEPFIDKLNLICMMDKSIHQIILNCNLTIPAQFICDRCNSEYKTKLISDFSLVYIFDNKENIDDTNVFFISSKEDKIDITNDIIDYAKLTIPLKKLCNEDCKGLCFSCGVNLNLEKCNCKSETADPTWEPLLKLKNKLN